MIRVHKRSFSLLFRRCAALLCAAALLSACSRPAQPDLTLLCDQIKKEAPRFTIAPEALFFSNNVFYYFYSLHEEDDLLLTLREDDRQKLCRITLTAGRNSAAAKEDLPVFGELLARLLLPDCDIPALREATGLREPPARTAGDGAPAAFYRAGHYRAALYAGEHALCFIIEKLPSADDDTQSAESESASEDGETTSTETDS